MKLEDQDTASLLAVQTALEAELAALRRGNRIGARLHAHQRVVESFAALEGELDKLGAALRAQLARVTAPLPADMLVRVAALRALQEDETLADYLHELVEREPLRGEGDPFDKIKDSWPVRGRVEIEAELQPVQAELDRRGEIADAEAELERIESRRVGLLERIGGRS